VDTKHTEALDDAFPGRTVADLRPAGPSWNERNETARIEFADGGAAYLKLALDGDGTRIERERTVIDYVRARSAVAVPRIVASDTDRERPFLATASMRERNLAGEWSDLTHDNRAAVIRRIGASLAEIHARSFERHGHIVGGGADGLALEPGDWTDVLVERIRMMRQLAPIERFEHHFDAVIGAVEANRGLLDEAPATLVHGDPAQPNCVFDDDGRGFVDWELAHVGDPARELHRARDQLLSRAGERERRLAEALHEGYRTRAGSLPAGFADRTPVYDAVRQLGKSGFFEKWAEFSDETLERLAARVDAEMTERLERIR
jgi:aminoglycoside phosphotransferase (APT) family kinase protein